MNNYCIFKSDFVVESNIHNIVDVSFQNVMTMFLKSDLRKNFDDVSIDIVKGFAELYNPIARFYFYNNKFMSVDLSFEKIDRIEINSPYLVCFSKVIPTFVEIIKLFEQRIKEANLSSDMFKTFINLIINMSSEEINNLIKH